MHRRSFLWQSGGGLGGIALSYLLGRERLLAQEPRQRADLNGGLHHPARAKRVVQLFMSGAASQVDTFDYKPLLIRRHGLPFDPGGRVELIAVRERDDVVILVRDNGIGLAPEALVGLFQLFSQVDASHDRSRSGLGIGLALVKSLVELHGGSVSAESPGPGRGATFTITLPLRSKERSA